MYEIETKNIYDDFSKNKEMFDFNKYSIKSKYYDDSNTLVDSKMRNDMGGIAIENVFGF